MFSEGRFVHHASTYHPDLSSRGRTARSGCSDFNVAICGTRNATHWSNLGREHAQRQGSAHGQTFSHVTGTSRNLHGIESRSWLSGYWTESPSATVAGYEDLNKIGTACLVANFAA